MLAIWNRRELVTVLTMQEQSDILSALRDAGLDYTVKAIDRPQSGYPGRLRYHGHVVGGTVRVHHLCEQEGLRCRAGRGGASRRHSLNQKQKVRPVQMHGPDFLGRREGSASPRKPLTLGLRGSPGSVEGGVEILVAAPRRRKVHSARDTLAGIPRCAPLRLLSGRDPLRGARARFWVSWRQCPDLYHRPRSCCGAAHRPPAPSGAS